MHTTGDKSNQLDKEPFMHETTNRTIVTVNVSWIMWLLFAMAMFALGYAVGGASWWVPMMAQLPRSPYC